MKYKEHPILGKRQQGNEVEIYFEGKAIFAEEGEPIAIALLNAGIKDFRYTRRKHESRGVYCAIGRCTDCMMTINGQPNIRTCVTPVEAGMTIERGKYGGTAND